jgi:predicted transcriptional regulator
MSTLTPIARNTLAIAILRDIATGQSSTDWIARRLKIDTATADDLLADLVAAENAATAKIADTITVYRITPRGLDLIA